MGRGDNFLLNKNAIYCLAFMLGENASEIVKEESAETPNMERLEKLRKHQNKFLTEQKQIYNGDRQVQEACLREYTPIIHQGLRPWTHFEKPEASLLI